MKIIAQKVCNALIKDADVSFPSEFLFHITGMELMMKAMKYFTGGLWVGGNIILQEDNLLFKPNKLNRVAHKGDISWMLPLKRIDQIYVSWGGITNIINIKTSSCSFKIRCYGAKKFSEEISKAISML